MNNIRRCLEVEWIHEEGTQAPCYICSDTEKTFFELLDEVTPLLEADGISVIRSERTVPGCPNTICLNGKHLLDLIDLAEQGQRYCKSTKWHQAEITRQSVIGADGIMCHHAPEILYRKAILYSLEPESRSLQEK